MTQVNRSRSSNKEEVSKDTEIIPRQQMPYIVCTSQKFIIAGIVVSALVAFAIGSAARVFLLYGREEISLEKKPPPILHSHNVNDAKSKSAGWDLPTPKMRGEREVPHTLYTSRVLDIAATSSARSMLVESTHHSSVAKLVTDLNRLEFEHCFESDQDAIDSEGNDVANKLCSVSPSTVALYAEETESLAVDTSETSPQEEQEEEAEEIVHLPAGQHLLVDIKNVEYEFLNDERRLAQAMVDLVWEADLTLLSYHCHTMIPSGVSCVGVLLESHISFHTWPEMGVITLDLFTCGSGPLIPIVPLIERLFAIPQEADSSDDEEVGGEEDAPVMVWSHKFRGFRDKRDEDPDSVSPLAERKDLGFALSKMELDLKQQVITTETDFQTIDIWDMIHPKFRDIKSHRRSMDKGIDSYESRHPEFYRPNRQVYLDGIVQSTRFGNEPYHEALVHPGMFAHSNPKRVAIIGGGEGATLREVLKHRTVEHVKMIEIDEIMVNVSRQYLPDWNDCSDIIGSTPSCFDDPRAEVRYEDALAWFMNHFREDMRDPATGLFDPNVEKEKFDVIIMDALDPQDNVAFSQALYSNYVFTRSLYNALTDKGVIILQLGESLGFRSLPDEMTKFHTRSSMETDLQQVGFQSVHQYEEGSCDFGAPWTLIVAFKDYSTRQNWYASGAELSVAIRKRILPSNSGDSPLKNFDASTMGRFQVPHPFFETLFCRRGNDRAEECDYLRGYDPRLPNADAPSFEIRPSARAIDDGYGVFAKVDIPAGSMIMQEKSSNSLQFPPSTVNVMEHLNAMMPEGAKQDLDKMFSFLFKHGYEDRLLGERGYDAYSSFLSLINHGCDGTFNVNSNALGILTEAQADPDDMPNINYSKGYSKSVMNPVRERHIPHIIGGYDIALRDIKAGEEVLDNHLTTVASEESWFETVELLKTFCAAQHVEGVSVVE